MLERIASASGDPDAIRLLYARLDDDDESVRIEAWSRMEILSEVIETRRRSVDAESLRLVERWRTGQAA